MTEILMTTMPTIIGHDYSVFRFFNGEFQKQFKSPGRPLMSQEMSTGYPNAETGHTDPLLSADPSESLFINWI